MKTINRSEMNRLSCHQCTVTCGQGLRYRVVLCIDHRGLHAGGCNPTTKPHIKEECLVTVPCYKSIGGLICLFLPGFNHQSCTQFLIKAFFSFSFAPDTLPVEAKPLWHKQAIELEEEIIVTEEPTWVPTTHNQARLYVHKNIFVASFYCK